MVTYLLTNNVKSRDPVGTKKKLVEKWGYTRAFYFLDCQTLSNVVCANFEFLI